MAIAILTSGGDSPGMNACLRAIVRKALHENIEVYGVYEGFKGLYENNIFKMNRKAVAEIINRGGTVLRSARFVQFQEPGIAEIAKQNLDKHNIDTLFIIGGNGSYLGGVLLSKLGVNVINLPGTIDNDILGTEYTIGFDTAVNTVVEAVDKVRDTSSSHHRASIIEVMGRNNGDIAFRAGLACGAEAVITCETGFDEKSFIDGLLESKGANKTHAIILLSENSFDINEVAKVITDNINMDVNKIILGHIQRGGTPSAYDRAMATLMGHKALELYQNGEVNICISLVENELVGLKFDDYLLLNNGEDLIVKKKLSQIINDVK